MQAILSRPEPVSMFFDGSSLYWSLRNAIDGVILAEDDAPDFDVAVIFDIIGQEFDTQMFRVPAFAAVEENLGVRAARAFADLPIVAFERNQMRGIDALLLPNSHDSLSMGL
jgi:hypothetical protein